MMFVTITGKQHVDSGKLRALATRGTTRYEPFKDVPTFEEVGVKGLSTTVWVGLATSKGVPQPIVAKLWQAMAASLKDESVRAKLTGSGFVVVSQSPSEFEREVREEIDQVHALGKRINLKLQ